MKTRQMGAIPPSAILSRKGIARYGGGISHWAAKSGVIIWTPFIQGQPSLRVRGGEPEGVRKRFLSKKVFLCSKKAFRKKKGF